MLYYGIALILSAGPAFAGVLHALRHALVAELHEALLRDPLAPATGWVQRRHLRHACASCSMIAELQITRLL